MAFGSAPAHFIARASFGAGQHLQDSGCEAWPGLLPQRHGRVSVAAEEGPECPLLRVPQVRLTYEIGRRTSPSSAERALRPEQLSGEDARA
jgi:hypothetical protein